MDKPLKSNYPLSNGKISFREPKSSTNLQTLSLVSQSFFTATQPHLSKGGSICIL